MNWSRISASLLLTISLALCGCTAKSVSPEATQNVRTVGIISAIGDDLAYQSLPVYMWQPLDEYQRDVSLWKIDAFITEELSRALRPQYEIVPVEFDRAAFQDKKLYGSVSSAGTMPNAGPIGEVVRANVRNPKADLFLVVLKGRTSVGATRYFAEGMGILRTRIARISRSYYHTVYRIAVVDGRSFKPLAILDGVNDAEHPFSGLIHGSPYEEIEAARWAEQKNQVTVEQAAWVMEEIKELFARTLPATLRRLNLPAS